MRRAVLIGVPVIAGGGLVALWVAVAMLGGDSSDDGGTPEPSSCLTGATIQVAASPVQVSLGGSSTVSWSVGLPNGCGGVHVRFSGDSVARSGSRVVRPPRASRFTVVVSETRNGVYAQTTRSVDVAVVYPPRVVIDPSTPNPVQVLLGTIVESTNPEQTVELCDVDLDLTGVKGVIISSNRWLIASPACARGPRSTPANAGGFGPRIFVTDRRGSEPLFIVDGDNVHISGFRLEGPSTGIMQGGITERGIRISPARSDAPSHDVVISNMEIFHWSGAGVDILDNVELAERGRLFNTNEGAVRVVGNFIHHNRHGAGFGYGVNVGAGGYALIAQNVFDENRHAISGDSKNDNGLDFSGYTARDNLILSGGGKHCIEGSRGFVLDVLSGRTLRCRHTHLVDMHGDGNRFYSDNNWQCGTAGETIIIERNTILYTSGLAIKIRGNPADKAIVDGNVFKHGSRGDAIAQNGFCGFGDNITKPIDVRPTNAFGVDPMKQLGSCDFAGDGQQDEFMATGATWWARSPDTKQWRYLNTMPERLPQLQLGDVDGDGICDVAIPSPHPAMPPRRYSKSGTGPWQSFVGPVGPVEP